MRCKGTGVNGWSRYRKKIRESLIQGLIYRILRTLGWQSRAYLLLLGVFFERLCLLLSQKAKNQHVFLVNSGYFLKCGITLSISTLSSDIFNTAAPFLLLLILMVPPPKYAWMLFSKAKSLMCNSIWNAGTGYQPGRVLSLLAITIVKEASHRKSL